MWSSVELESINGSSTSLPAATTGTYTGRRLERFVNSWEGVLEESVDESEASEYSFRLRVSISRYGAS